MKQQHTVCLCVVFLSGRFGDCCVLVVSERNAKVINRLVFLFGERKKKIQRCQKVFRVFIENITLTVPTVWGCIKVKLFYLCEDTRELRALEALQLPLASCRPGAQGTHTTHSTPLHTTNFIWFLPHLWQKSSTSC